MKINTILAGTLALVLIAGLGTPAFAEPHRTFAEPHRTQSQSGFVSSADIADMQTAHNIVFDNGGAPDAGEGFALEDSQKTAEDFVIATDTFVTDFHFVSIGQPLDIVHTIYADAGGFPGAVLASGSPQDLVTNELSTNIFEVWFDLEDPFLAEAGVTYWFGLESTNPGDGGAWIETNSGGTGSFIAVTNLPTVDWEITDFHAWFLLSGHPADEVVGGEFLPIDSTALILAGAQTNAVWIMSALAVIGSVAFGALYITKRKN